MGEGAPVVLIVGGIQGDEPGGFSAASLLATRYRFQRGTVWVVPNLNFPSIIRRSRGVYGDMNRKFAELNAGDPEFETVRRIQNLIVMPEVKLVLNLHDGSGLYRPTRESAMRNPDRWGQSVIIDQDEWPGLPFGQLRRVAETVTGEANRGLLAPEHVFHVKNTDTGTKNDEMTKCLTWFALNHGKAAFGLEVSKDFDVARRAYYHLLMVESFLRQAGLEFERNFPLSPAGVSGALGNGVHVGFVNNRVVLPLDNARRQQAGSLPLPRGAEQSISATMPIVAVTAGNNTLDIHYGNNTVTSFRPDWMKMDEALASVAVDVDGESHEVRFGEIIPVRRDFRVRPLEGYRVNAIGATLGVDESNLLIRRRDFQERYSIDKAGTTYRVEVYKGRNTYAGTFLVRFGSSSLTASGTPGVLPSLAGPESSLGR